MACPSFITSQFTDPADLYNVTTDEDTLTGQPIEKLVFLKRIFVKFQINITDAHQLFPAGQIPIGKFVALAGEPLIINQTLDIDGTFYRVIASNPAKVKRRVYFHTVHLELFEHPPLP